MILYLSAHSELEVKDPAKQQVQESLDELLRFTDDAKLKNEGFLVLAVDRSGLTKRLRPPLLQVVASAYGWFVEYLDADGSAIQRTSRNSVSEEALRVAFYNFLKSPGRPDNLSWREGQQGTQHHDAMEGQPD